MNLKYRPAMFFGIVLVPMASYLGFMMYYSQRFPSNQWPAWFTNTIAVWFIASFLIVVLLVKRIFKGQVVDAEKARNVTVDPLQKILPGQRATKEAEIRRHDPTAADRPFVFCLLKTRDERKTNRVRHEFEVNMRESEREQLARRDAYERELERRAKKRKHG
jgi:hypothetical protein